MNEIAKIELDYEARARSVLPAGTLGNTTHAVVIREGRAGRIWDEAGREDVDFLLAPGRCWSAMRIPR